MLTVLLSKMMRDGIVEGWLIYISVWVGGQGMDI